ncbi:MAG TPA: hypothetical protein VFG50_16515, partial [Rhodothermales bacterium]|nr:hypothetical protein [Rhodothermales bacterium]
MLLAGEQIIDAIELHSPRAAVCLATSSRLIHLAQDPIGCRIVSLPYDRITSIGLARQRHITTVQIMHASGTLMLTSSDAAHLQRIA